MNVKQGDLVKVNGVGSVVETSWGAGKHKVFKLKDGRQILDLDKLIAAGKATIEVVREPEKKVFHPGPASEKKWSM